MFVRVIDKPDTQRHALRILYDENPANSGLDYVLFITAGKRY
jgi:hypothetical protein